MTILFEPVEQRAQQLGSTLGANLRAVSSLEQLQRALAADPAELLVLFGPGTAASDALHFAAKQRTIRPSLGLILLRDDIDVATLGSALRAGIRDVVPAGDSMAVLAACAHSRQVSQQLTGAGAAQSSREAKIITVFAAKGGCGKSTLATNIAVTLASGGHRRVCLIDLDLAFGDIGIMLQLAPQRSLAGVPDNPEAVSVEVVRSMLTPYRPGLEVLLAPVGPAEAERLRRDVVGAVLKVVATQVDFVVVDTPAQFTDHVLTALDLAHLQVLVATPDVPALKNLRIALDMLDLLKLPVSRRAIVLNRSDARVGLTPADIERVLQLSPDTLVPSSRDVPISINRGMPIVVDKPNHPVSKAIRAMVASRIVPLAAATSGGPEPAGRLYPARTR
ncbi:MAG: P-loop NTPase [Micromonosporaceae bacterium]|nr:P-loop NTPase [Micromonosporaceae bacterium]